MPVVLVAASVTLLEPDDAIPLVGTTLLVSLPTIPFVGLGVLGAPRIARILRCYPWRAVPCRYIPEGRNFVMALAIAPDQELLLHPTPYSCDLRRKQNPHPDIIWFAGDPACGGVASPTGGHYPQRVIRPSHSGAELPPADERAERAGLARNGRYLRRWL
ncbi:hypothetical protein ACWCXB_08670 [Streptomyces sp. NPDC001514]